VFVALGAMEDVNAVTILERCVGLSADCGVFFGRLGGGHISHRFMAGKKNGGEDGEEEAEHFHKVDFD